MATASKNAGLFRFLLRTGLTDGTLGNLPRLRMAGHNRPRRHGRCAGHPQRPQPQTVAPHTQWVGSLSSEASIEMLSLLKELSVYKAMDEDYRAGAKGR